RNRGTVTLNDKVHGRRGCPARRSRRGARLATQHCQVDRLRALDEPRQRLLPCQTTWPEPGTTSSATMTATRSRSRCSFLFWAPDGGAGFVLPQAVLGG